jgi:hypothetical protein
LIGIQILTISTVPIRYFLNILTRFFLSVGPPGVKEQAYVIRFSISVNFVELIKEGSGSGQNLGTKTDPGK